MMTLQNIASFVVINETDITNGEAFVSSAIDCKGYDEAMLDFYLTTQTVVTANPSLLNVTESDDTVATNFATFTGSVGDTDFTIPAVATAASTKPHVRLHVDLRARKRYLKMLITPTTTHGVHGVAHLARAEQLPNTDAERNVDLQTNI